MQITSLPFWLMIVSSATAVLPVCRSPMISCRWPRPIAVIASIAVMPVYRGSFTGWRGLAEDDAPDLRLVEVERDAEQAAGELEQFVGHRARQTRHAGDAVTGL